MMVVKTRRRKRTEDEHLMRANMENDAGPSNGQRQAPPPKKMGRSSVRRVQFDTNPTIFNITPLVEKQPGIIRMPEASKSIQEDMESPPADEEQLSDLSSSSSNLSTSEEGIEDMDENSQESVHIIEEASRQSVQIIDDESNQQSVQFIDEVSQHSVHDDESSEQRRQLLDTITVGRKETKAGNVIYEYEVPSMEMMSRDSEIEEEQEAPTPSESVQEHHGKEITELLSDKCMDSDDMHAFHHGRARKAQAQRLPWCQLFAPSGPREFLGKSKLDCLELKEWLDFWAKRLGWLKQEESKKKKAAESKGQRKKRAIFEEEDAEGDSDQEFDCEPEIEQLKNPLVLEGPNGCGKTAMVAVMSRACNFEVLEISAAELRDGQVLKQKLAGALESHNVQNRSPGDIRSLFSQQRKRQNTSFTSTTSAKPKAEFTVILIEECDLIFAADTNFWPVLKSICAESRVPIVLTCNDYEHVATELNKEPSLLDYKTIHMERPCIKLLSRYLRPWTFGISGFCQKMPNLLRLIEAKQNDPRAVLNALQAGEVVVETSQRAQQSTSDERVAISVREMKRKARLLAAIDSAWAPTGDGLSLLAKRLTNLDDSNDMLAQNFETRLQERRQHRADYMDFLTFNCEQEIAPAVKHVVKLGCLRSGGRRLYSVRETVLDHLPLMLAIDRAWTRNLNGARELGRRAPPHPFDVVDERTGQMIDGTQTLKVTINSFELGRTERSSWN